jgi:ATP-binding cassette subfamily F protein 3
VQADYFAQDQYKELDPEKRVLDDIWELAPHHTQTDLRSLLGCFLFTEDDVFKRIGVLSGGERNRYALARMLLHPANFLLLDEPTNHLDLRAKDVLLESLEKYSGTVVFVSHDRYFIDKLATRVFEIGGGEVRVYPGNYEDYRWRKEREAAGEETPLRASLPEIPVETAARPSQNQKKVNPIKLKQMQDRCAELEELIEQTEQDIRECEKALESFVSAEETQRQTALLAERKAGLEALLSEWGELSENLQTSR